MPSGCASHINAATDHGVRALLLVSAVKNPGEDKQGDEHHGSDDGANYDPFLVGAVVLGG